MRLLDGREVFEPEGSKECCLDNTILKITSRMAIRAFSQLCVDVDFQLQLIIFRLRRAYPESITTSFDSVLCLQMGIQRWSGIS